MSSALGYIGLGAMGMPFMRHLAAGGHTLAVYDTDPAKLDSLRDQPAITICGSVAEVTEAAEVVFTNLPSVAAVETVYANVDRAGIVCCDNSTVGPTRARTLHGQLAARGIHYVECPMLGSAADAESGQLFLLLSGDPEPVDRVLPLVQLAGRECRVVGGPGRANLIKTVQNGLGLIQVGAIAEALGLVVKAGGDPLQFIEIVNAGKGMAASPLFAARAPRMCDLEAPAAGKLYIGAKDSSLGKELADELDADSPLFQASAALFANAMASGLAESDSVAVIKVIEERLAVAVRREQIRDA